MSSFDLDPEDQHFTSLTYFSHPFDADFAEADECRAKHCYCFLHTGSKLGWVSPVDSGFGPGRENTVELFLESSSRVPAGLGEESLKFWSPMSSSSRSQLSQRPRFSLLVKSIHTRSPQLHIFTFRSMPFLLFLLISCFFFSVLSLPRVTPIAC